MNIPRRAILSITLAGLLHAGESGIDLAALPASDDAKDSVLLRPPVAAPQPWSLAAGPIFRKIGEIDFRTGISPGMIPNLFGADTFTEPPGIGPLGATADRTYDDGFVNIGAGTPGTGLTTFWSYDRANQVQGDNLVFSRTGGERRDVTMQNTAAATGWDSDADWEAGPFLELTYSVPIRTNLTGGFALNFSSVNLGGAQSGLNTLSQFQQLDIYDVTALDTFGLNGIVPPAPPYAGSFDGPGALLGNVPDSRTFPEALASTTTAPFIDSVHDHLDVDLYTLGLGGSLTWTPRPQFLLSAQAGLAINLADWSAQRDEVITRSNNGGPAGLFSSRTVQSDEREVLAGFYLQGNAAWMLSEHWAIQGFARYDWNQDLDGSVGPSSFNVDLSGWSIGAGARLSF
jgi:hypothetical protein